MALRFESETPHRTNLAQKRISTSAFPRKLSREEERARKFRGRLTFGIESRAAQGSSGVFFQNGNGAQRLLPADATAI